MALSALFPRSSNSILSLHFPIFWSSRCSRRNLTRAVLGRCSSRKLWHEQMFHQRSASPTLRSVRRRVRVEAHRVHSNATRSTRTLREQGPQGLCGPCAEPKVARGDCAASAEPARACPGHAPLRLSLRSGVPSFSPPGHLIRQPRQIGARSKALCELSLNLLLAHGPTRNEENRFFN